MPAAAVLPYTRPVHPKFALAAGTAAALFLLAGLAQSAERPAGYPAQPVRLVVPFPPGGTSDIVARVIGQRLSTTVGQRFVVENRPGAGAAIGIVAVTSASPDGQTLLLGAAGPLTMSPHMGDPRGEKCNT